VCINEKNNWFLKTLMAALIANVKKMKGNFLQKQHNVITGFL